MCLRGLSALLVAGAISGTARTVCSAGMDTQIPAKTEAEAAKELIVWIRGADEAWAARAEGQLSDLPARIRRRSEPLEPNLEQQVTAARALGTDGVVAWLWPTGKVLETARWQEGAFFVAWFPGPERLYMRRVGPAQARSDPAEWSATLEFAALALRTAVRAALAGQKMGAEPERFVASAKPTPKAPRRASIRAGPASDTRAFLVAAASWTFDGRTGGGLLSMGPGVGVTLGGWHLGALGQLGLPARIEAEYAKLALRRSTLIGAVGRVFEASSTLSVTALAHAGTAWFRRDTESKSDRLLAADPNTTVSSALGLASLVHWEVAPHTLVGLEAGADWVPSAPTLRLEREDHSVLVSYPLWPVQPYARLSLGAVW